MTCTEMGQVMGGMMGQMSGGMMGGGWQWLAVTGWIVLLVVGVALAWAIARRPSGLTADDPDEILRRRYARGELTADEFAAARKTLG